MLYSQYFLICSKLYMYFFAFILKSKCLTNAPPWCSSPFLTLEETAKSCLLLARSWRCRPSL